MKTKINIIIKGEKTTHDIDQISYDQSKVLLREMFTSVNCDHASTIYDRDTNLVSEIYLHLN